MNAPAALWLIFPVVLLIAAGFLYLFIKYWQTGVAVDIKQAQVDLRRFKINSKSFQQSLHKDYSHGDPEPFGSRVADLLKMLGDFDHQLQDLYITYTEVQQSIAQASARRWQSFILMSVNWYQIRQQMDVLKQSVDRLSKSYEEIEKGFRDFKRLGWEVANQARGANRKMLDAGFLIDHLANQNVHGDIFEAVTSQHKILQENLKEIPAYFLTSGEEKFLGVVDKNEVVKAYQLLSERRSTLDNLLRQVKTWNDQYARASENLLVLLKSIEKLKQSLNHASEELNLTDIQVHLNQVIPVVNDQDDKLAQPTVEDLPRAARETSRMLRVVNDLEHQFTEAFEHMADLKNILTGLSQGVTSISTDYMKLEKTPFYPIVWDKSRPQLGEARRQVKSLNSVVEPRTPDEVKHAYDLAVAISDQLDELKQVYQRIEKQHSDFISMMQILDVTKGLEWCHQARESLNKVSEYNPENWSKNEDLKLQPDLENLEDKFKHKIPQNPLIPIKESELAQQLSEAFQIVDLYQMLQNLVKSIQKRLTDLQNLEGEAREKLKTTQAILNQVGFIAESNNSLDTIVAAETDTLQRNAEELITELDRHRVGLVERKVKKVKIFVDGFERISSSWLSQLLFDVEAIKNDMSAVLNDLNAVPPVDEAIISEARQLISQDEPPDGQEKLPKKSAIIPLSGLSTAFKRVNEEWQRCAAAMEELREVSTPVLETYHSVSEQRQEAKNQVDRVSGWISSRSVYSSRSQAFNHLNQEYEGIEKDWDAQKEKRVAASLVNQNLERYAGRYQAVIEKARQLADQVENEQKRIDQLKHELDESIQLWVKQQKIYSNNVTAHQEIDRLLNEVDRNLANVEEQYQHERIAYPQLIQTISSLCKRLNNAQITIEGDQKIDINGEI